VPRPETRPRGGLEREVIACLAAAGRPVTAAEVQNDLGSGLAYTTVMTTLGRLHDKGALIRDTTGRAYTYELRGTADTVGSSQTARQMRRLLETRQDRAGVLARFVADLDPEDERVLTELLSTTGPEEEPE